MKPQTSSQAALAGEPPAGHIRAELSQQLGEIETETPFQRGQRQALRDALDGQASWDAWPHYIDALASADCETYLWMNDTFDIHAEGWLAAITKHETDYASGYRTAAIRARQIVKESLDRRYKTL